LYSAENMRAPGVSIRPLIEELFHLLLNSFLSSPTSFSALPLLSFVLNGGFAGDGGAAIGAELNYPSVVAFDAAVNMYIADTGNDAFVG
jgi:hypothetical protein